MKIGGKVKLSGKDGQKSDRERDAAEEDQTGKAQVLKVII